MPKPPILRWNDCAGAHDSLICARGAWRGSQTFKEHSHDFYEIFYVEKGQGTHRINDKAKRLEEGMMVYIRPPDSHTFWGRGAEGITVVNSAFKPSVTRRLSLGLGVAWKHAFAPDAALPHHWKPPAEVRPRIRETLLRAETGPRDELASMWLLIELLSTFHRNAGRGRREGTPDWLLDAVIQLREPVHFRAGTAGLAALAARSPEHVARETRRHYGCTPSDLVNRARLDYAARRIELNRGNVTEIALDCGFESVSYFIRLFRERFGQPPLHYRRRRLGLLS